MQAGRSYTWGGDGFHDYISGWTNTVLYSLLPDVRCPFVVFPCFTYCPLLEVWFFLVVDFIAYESYWFCVSVARLEHWAGMTRTRRTINTRCRILLILRLLIFRTAISVSLFLDLGREWVVSLARCTHRSLLQVPAYLAHASTVSHTSYQPGS